MMKKIAAALGLDENATEEQILAAIAQMKTKAANDKAMAAALSPIAKAAGLADGADDKAIEAAVVALAAQAKAAPGADQVKELQAELVTVTTQLNGLLKSVATDKATAFVDGEIAKGRMGVKPLRDHFIARHAAGDAANVVKEIEALPIVTASGALQTPPPKDKDGAVALNAEQEAAARLLGLDPKEYAKTLAAEQAAAA
jgi:phage I-like protein